MGLFEKLKFYKTEILCKRKQLYFFVHFFLLFSEKEGRKRTKERRKNRCDHSQKIRSKSTSEFWEQVTAENAPASAFLVLNLRITDEKAEKAFMLAEKAVQKNKPTEACGRRIAQGGLIAMLAQTKRWGLDSKGKGWNRNPQNLH